ncbi:MAG: transcriptional regulator GlxA family with amidase domain [Ilumatobacter sp.]
MLWEAIAVQVALVLFPGVSIDECEAFALAFRQLAQSGLADCQLVGVGAVRGEIVGIGGRRDVEQTFAETTRPDVVLVPGGIGVERTAHDEALLSWLRSVEPSCQWMAASSTGTVVVAAAGLLAHRPAATHWLAGSKLAEFGSEASAERIVEVGHVVTCHGRISAMDVALLMILRLTNRSIAEQVRVDLERAREQAAASQPSRWTRLVHLVHPAARGPARPRNEQLDTSDWVEMELTADPSSTTPSGSPWDRPESATS